MKRALVTGGSGDLGGAIARRLARDGLHVIVHANARLEAAEAVAADLRAQGGSAEAVAFDVTDAQASATALEALLAAGAIQVLVNNAGIHDDAVFPGMRPEQWHRVIDVSLHGFFHVTQPLTLPMARTRWGRIVSVSSVAAVLGNRGQVNYAAAKAGMQGFTKTLAKELGKFGITANSVAPGFIATEMTKATAERVGMGFEDFQAAAATQIPVQRVGQPEDVANAIAFFTGDAAGFVSGQVLYVAGGPLN
jgi:3-oxoacyl-[acyl-carrier protein] reductase